LGKRDFVLAMSTEPSASARVFWVVDNDSSRRGQAAARRLTADWPNAILVPLPVHASWLNQVSTSPLSSAKC